MQLNCCYGEHATHVGRAGKGLSQLKDMKKLRLSTTQLVLSSSALLANTVSNYPYSVVTTTW